MTEHLAECAGGFGCRCPVPGPPAAWSPFMDRILVLVCTVVGVLTVVGVFTVHR